MSDTSIPELRGDFILSSGDPKSFKSEAAVSIKGADSEVSFWTNLFQRKSKALTVLWYVQFGCKTAKSYSVLANACISEAAAVLV